MGSNLPLLNRRRRAGGFSPAVLFSAGEQGAWLDPSDFTTLFQDSTGVTPVTAVAQTAALVFDKSKGLTLGPESVTNGDFSSGAIGWTVGTGWSISGGTAAFSNATGTALSRADLLAIPAGRYPKLEFDLTYTSGTGVLIGLNIGGGINNFGTFSGSGRKTAYVLTTVSRTGIQLSAVGGSIFSVDNISVKELQGNHAAQATAGARPTLRVTAGGVYYLEDDGGDSLNWTAPAGTYTIAHVNSVGAVTIQTAQALSGATDALVAQYLAGYVAVNRALTEAETSALTAYLAAKGGA